MIRQNLWMCEACDYTMPCTLIVAWDDSKCSEGIPYKCACDDIEPQWERVVVQEEVVKDNDN